LGDSKPLEWSDLNGKLVVLVFWAEWCDECKPVLQRLGTLQQEWQGRSDIVIIGVHAAGSSPAEVEKAAKEYELKFPIYIDSPQAWSYWWGNYFDALQVMGMPEIVAVDPHGIFLDHGPLDDMIRTVNAYKK
jgi:thiol-disulfide isomerase/thioredoxin